MTTGPAGLPEFGGPPPGEPGLRRWVVEVTNKVKTWSRQLVAGTIPFNPTATLDFRNIQDAIEGVEDLIPTTEELQDLVGDMVTGNDETTGFTAVYDDAAAKIDFTFALLTYLASAGLNVTDYTDLDSVPTGFQVFGASTPFTNSPTGNRVSGIQLAHASTRKIQIVFDDLQNTTVTPRAYIRSMGTSAAWSPWRQILATSDPATDEYIQDLVGAMVTGNVETNLVVTYDDTNGKYDLALSNAPTITGAMTAGAFVATQVGTGFSSYTYLRGDSATFRGLVLQTGTTERWLIVANNTAESGANAGSDLSIYRYSDAAGFLGTAAQCIRATGAWDFGVSIEADAYSVAGTALAEYISDTVGAMFSSNTESNVIVTYQDGDNTIDVEVPDASTSTKGVAELATQAEMEAASSTTIVPTVQGVNWHPGVAKGWAYITYSGSTPSITASHNVSSIGDTATGRVTVNWNTDFSSANFAVVATIFVATGNARMATVSSYAAGASVIDCYTDAGVLTDGHTNVVAFGDQ